MPSMHVSRRNSYTAPAALVSLALSFVYNDERGTRLRHTLAAQARSLAASAVAATNVCCHRETHSRSTIILTLRAAGVTANRAAGSKRETGRRDAARALALDLQVHTHKQRERLADRMERNAWRTGCSRIWKTGCGCSSSSTLSLVEAILSSALALSHRFLYLFSPSSLSLSVSLSLLLLQLQGKQDHKGKAQERTSSKKDRGSRRSERGKGRGWQRQDGTGDCMSIARPPIRVTYTDAGHETGSHTHTTTESDWSRGGDDRQAGTQREKLTYFLRSNTLTPFASHSHHVTKKG